MIFIDSVFAVYQRRCNIFMPLSISLCCVEQGVLGRGGGEFNMFNIITKLTMKRLTVIF